MSEQLAQSEYSQGQSEQGNTLFTVVVTPEHSDERLRWNMPVQLTIMAGEQ